MALGLNNKEIAYLMGITEGTVKVHLAKTYREIGLSGVNVNERVTLARLWWEKEHQKQHDSPVHANVTDADLRT